MVSSVALWTFTLTATRVLVPVDVSTAWISLIVPLSTGVWRFAKETMPTMMATAATATRMGTIGGSVHFAESISSVIGVWPALAVVFGGRVTGGSCSGMCPLSCCILRC